MDTSNPQQNKAVSSKNRIVKVLLQLGLSLLVLGCSFALATYYLKTSPKAKPRKRTPRPPLVQVENVRFSSPNYTIEGMGTVIGSEEVDLTPRVSGEVISISDQLMPGGLFQQHSLLLQIDARDYELTLLQLKSELAKAQSDLDLEMGNQRIALKEFELLGQQVSETEKKLMLRMPQLGIAKANLNGVKARLKKVELDLSRTSVAAPFNAVILEKKVAVGSRVTPSTMLAKLVGTDSFWVKITVPVDQLQWFTIPSNKAQDGSAVKIFPGSKVGPHSYRSGKIIRLGAGLEQDGRMAQVYAEVKDPLCLLPANNKLPKLLLDSFVRAEIKGHQFSEIAVIAREQLRTDGAVWLLDENNRLEIRKVEVAASTRDKVYITSGLSASDRIITSQLASPVAGTGLRVMGSETEVGARSGEGRQ